MPRLRTPLTDSTDQFDTATTRGGSPTTPTMGYNPPAPPIPAVPPPAAAPAPTGIGSYAIQPVDPAKLQDKHDAKYDFLRIASNYDPSQGISQGMLDQLNQLGYGNFSGSGDHLSISGITDAGRAAGLDPHDFSGDFIQGLHSSHPQWAWDWYDDGSGNLQPIQVPVSGSGSGGGVGSVSASTSSTHPNGLDFIPALQQIINSGGSFNQGAFNSRLDAVRGALDRQRKSQADTDRAIMADRGLLGSGVENSATARLGQDVSDSFSNSLQQIYADEADRADSRLIQALQMATGMSEEEARNAVSMAGINADYQVGMTNAQTGRLRANNDFTLGQGNLALGNMNAANNYNLGLANFGLSRDEFLHNTSQDSIGNLIKLIQMLGNGADTSANGFV